MESCWEGIPMTGSCWEPMALWGSTQWAKRCPLHFTVEETEAGREALWSGRTGIGPPSLCFEGTSDVLSSCECIWRTGSVPLPGLTRGTYTLPAMYQQGVQGVPHPLVLWSPIGKALLFINQAICLTAMNSYFPQKGRLRYHQITGLEMYWKVVHNM